MTTLLESFGFFSDVFEFFIPFLLVFAVVFGILLKSKFLSDDSNVNAAIAFAVAIIVALGGGGEFLVGLTPFFAVFFVIIFFILMIFMFFGLDPKDIMQSKAIIFLVVAICAIFVFFVMGEMFGDQLAVVSVEDSVGNNITNGAPVDYRDETIGSQAVARILSHPKVLGMIVLLGLLAIATYFIVNKPN